MAIALEPDSAHFDLRAFAHHECDSDGCWGNGADFGPYRGELVTVLGFQLLNRHFGVLDLGWIVLRLGRETIALIPT